MGARRRALRVVLHRVLGPRPHARASRALLPACRPCNRARRSQAAAAYARRRADEGRAVDVDVLLAGLDRLAQDGTAAERDYGVRQGRMVRTWQRSERALAEHLERFAA